MTPESLQELQRLLLTKQPRGSVGSTTPDVGSITPMSPYEAIQAQRSQPSSDPVIANIQRLGRGVRDFFVPETPLDIALTAFAPAKVTKGLLKIDPLDDLKLILQDTKLTDAQKRKKILKHPAIEEAQKSMQKIPETRSYSSYGTDVYIQNRPFNVNNKNIVGYEQAVDSLYKNAREMAYRETGKKIPVNLMQKNTDKQKTATIMIGPPAAGKSAIANPIAIRNKATLVDSDEAKKIIPEFGGGIGANAVHHESKILANNVLGVAVSRGDNLVIPRIGAEPDKMKKEILKLKDKGYKVNLVLTELDPDLAFVRMNQRFIKKGRLINQDAAEAYRGKPSKTYEILKKEGVADGYGKIDTTTKLGQPKKIYEDTSGIFEGTGL